MRKLAACSIDRFERLAERLAARVASSAHAALFAPLLLPPPLRGSGGGCSRCCPCGLSGDGRSHGDAFLWSEALPFGSGEGRLGGSAARGVDGELDDSPLLARQLIAAAELSQEVFASSFFCCVSAFFNAFSNFSDAFCTPHT